MTIPPFQPRRSLAAPCRSSALLLCALLLSVSAFWGCAKDILGSDPSTGLVVSVSKGPIQPVAREGEDNSAPVDGAVVFIEATSGGDTTLKTDADGSFHVLLKPGDYVVTVQVCPGTMALPDPVPATVRDGSMIDVSLECDTGIR